MDGTSKNVKMKRKATKSEKDAGSNGDTKRASPHTRELQLSPVKPIAA